MSMHISINDKGSDFVSVGHTKVEGGLTKREYFAALAMQGLLASGLARHNLAECATKCADELIKELNK